MWREATTHDRCLLHWKTVVDIWHEHISGPRVLDLEIFYTKFLYFYTDSLTLSDDSLTLSDFQTDNSPYLTDWTYFLGLICTSVLQKYIYVLYVFCKCIKEVYLHSVHWRENIPCSFAWHCIQDPLCNEENAKPTCCCIEINTNKLISSVYWSDNIVLLHNMSSNLFRCALKT